jgi:diguanylate cyclase (GGDEF)-like protein/PAS domain S-box-containing protein
VRPLTQLTAGAELARKAPDASLPRISGYAEVTSLAASLDALLTERRKREEALIEARAVAERAEQQARDAHAYLTNAIEMLPEGIVIFDAEDRFYLWNRCFQEHYRINGELTRGQRFEDRLRASLANGLHRCAIGREEEWLQERLARRALPESSYEQPFGADRWLRVTERRMPDGSTIGVRTDITDLKHREESFRSLFENSPVPMWVHDSDTFQFLAVNEAAIELYGHSREEFLSLTAHDVNVMEYKAGTGPQRRAASQYFRERNWRHVRADGTTIDVTSYSRAIEHNGRQARLVAIVDVTDRTRAEARISHLAYHDDLTGLANRARFHQRLDEAIKRSRQEGNCVGVLHIDLDRFKEVNDALGHPVGDLLLRAVADRLKTCLRGEEAVARIGGDEFAIIQDDIGGTDEAEALARRLLDALGQPYDIEGRVLAVAASVGIAIAPRDGENADMLLKFADMALYSAKSEGGRAFRAFDPEMNVRAQERRALERDLRLAVANNEFEIHYQPSVNLAANKVSGFEALVRWNHPERGIISPADFIPVAEDIGLIEKLGEWVLRQACADAAKWPQQIRVAVNLSPLQFKSPNLVPSVLAALANSGLPARQLELEITESVLLQENETNLATLHRLRGGGARIALDDFGIGYSSLSYLRMFPFDKIKVDRSFVKSLPENRECVKIIRAMVELAKSLDMDITAEGIETPQQLAHLRADGCTEGQGFLYSPARPVSEVAEMLARCERDIERAA